MSDAFAAIARSLGTAGALGPAWKSIGDVDEREGIGCSKMKAGDFPRRQSSHVAGNVFSGLRGSSIVEP